MGRIIVHSTMFPLLIAGAFIAAGCESGGSQEDSGNTATLIEGSSSSCSSCNLTLTEVGIIGSEEGPGALESDAVMARRDRRGRYFLFNEYGSKISVYDPAGEFIGDVGRVGSGPGEFRIIADIEFSAEDSLHVFDLGLARDVVFSPTLNYAHSHQLAIPPSEQIVLLSDGRSVVADQLLTGNPAGLPFHVLSRNGDLVRSFGTADPSSDARTTSGLRIIATAGDTTIWVAHWNRYQLELWSLNPNIEKPLLTIERKASWFPAGKEDTESIEDPPATHIVDLRADSAGHILVMIRVADHAWRQSVRMRGREKFITDPNGYFDTILEVLDPELGEVLASARFPYMFGPFVDDTLVPAVEMDSSDIPFLHLWRVQFQQ